MDDCYLYAVHYVLQGYISLLLGTKEELSLEQILDCFFPMVSPRSCQNEEYNLACHKKAVHEHDVFQ